MIDSERIPPCLILLIKRPFLCRANKVHILSFDRLLKNYFNRTQYSKRSPKVFVLLQFIRTTAQGKCCEPDLTRATKPHCRWLSHDELGD